MRSRFLTLLLFVITLSTTSAEEPPPVRLEAILKEVTDLSTGKMFTYELKAMGTSEMDLYRVVSANLTQGLHRKKDQVVVSGVKRRSKMKPKKVDAGISVVVGKDGFLDTDPDGTHAQFFLGGLMEGEPIQFGLFNDSRDLISRCRVVPFPIEAHDDKGHSIEVVYLDTDATIFEINLHGYSEGEELLLISTSEGEIIEDEITFSHHNIYRCAPAVTGKKGGSATCRIVGEDSDLSVQYVWGNRWSKKAS